MRLVDSGIIEPELAPIIDDAILNALVKHLIPTTLHLYRREKVVSIGYSQTLDCLNLEFCKKNNIKIVRRNSGGGAIYVDEKQLTYSIAFESNLGVEEVFKFICSCIIEVLNILGVSAVYKPKNDVLVNNKKISGSAQIRKGKALLQHGTLIIELDREMMFGALNTQKKEVTSLKEVMGREPNMDEVKNAIIVGFEKRFNEKIIPGKLTDWERNEITSHTKLNNVDEY
ncbi:MAG: lipoate--protein ligase family protein [Candidatus Thermoplasmatota archaeon]